LTVTPNKALQATAAPLLRSTSWVLRSSHLRSGVAVGGCA
jgi:hypothetical protein